VNNLLNALFPFLVVIAIIGVIDIVEGELVQKGSLEAGMVPVVLFVVAVAAVVLPSLLVPK
jgi:hypothetical protein